MSENLELQAASTENFSLEPSNHVLNTAPVKELEEMGGGQYSPQPSHKEKQREERVYVVCVCVYKECWCA